MCIDNNDSVNEQIFRKNLSFVSNIKSLPIPAEIGVLEDKKRYTPVVSLDTIMDDVKTWSKYMFKDESVPYLAMHLSTEAEELLHAITKHNSGECDIEDVYEEMADVLIFIAKLHSNLNAKKSLSEIVGDKLKVLKKSKFKQVDGMVRRIKQ